MSKKLFALLLAALMVCGAVLALADAHCRAHAVRL